MPIHPRFQTGDYVCHTVTNLKYIALAKCSPDRDDLDDEPYNTHLFYTLNTFEYCIMHGSFLSLDKPATDESVKEARNILLRLFAKSKNPILLHQTKSYDVGEHIVRHFITAKDCHYLMLSNCYCNPKDPFKLYQLAHCTDNDTIVLFNNFTFAGTEIIAPATPESRKKAREIAFERLIGPSLTV